MQIVCDENGKNDIEFSADEKAALTQTGLPEEYVKVIARRAQETKRIIFLRSLNLAARPVLLGYKIGTMPYPPLCKPADIKLKTNPIDGSIMFETTNHLDEHLQIMSSITSTNAQRWEAYQQTQGLRRRNSMPEISEFPFPIIIGNQPHKTALTSLKTLAEKNLAVEKEGKMPGIKLGIATIRHEQKTHEYLVFISQDRTRAFHLRLTNPQDQYDETFEKNSTKTFPPDALYSFNDSLQDFIQKCEQWLCDCQRTQKDPQLISFIKLLNDAERKHEIDSSICLGQLYKITICEYKKKRYIYASDVDTLLICHPKPKTRPGEGKFAKEIYQRPYYPMELPRRVPIGEIASISSKADSDFLRETNIALEEQGDPAIFCHGASVWFPPDTSRPEKILMITPTAVIFCQTEADFCRNATKVIQSGQYFVPYRGDWPNSDELKRKYPDDILIIDAPRQMRTVSTQTDQTISPPPVAADSSHERVTHLLSSSPNSVASGADNPSHVPPVVVQEYAVINRKPTVSHNPRSRKRSVLSPKICEITIVPSIPAAATGTSGFLKTSSTMK